MHSHSRLVVGSHLDDRAAAAGGRAGFVSSLSGLAIRDGDKARARAEIDKITLLQSENELELSEALYFRYAKAATSAELSKQTL